MGRPKKEATPEKVAVFVKLLDEGWSPHVARARANLVTEYKECHKRLESHPEAQEALKRYREKAKLKHLGAVSWQLRSTKTDQ